MSTEIKTRVVVLGAGPAGYSIAFHCADLGLETAVVGHYNTLGGVYLNVGRIPSKALLRVAEVIEEVKALVEHDIVFGKPKTGIDKIYAQKKKVIDQLTGGLASMAEDREVRVVNGLGEFAGANTLEVEGENGKTAINFDSAAVAAGSRSVQLPFTLHKDPRVWDSTDVLGLKEVPERLLMADGDIIGLEMGAVYHVLGSQIDVVKVFDQVVLIADKDIAKVFIKRISKKFSLVPGTRTTAVKTKESGIYMTMEGKKAPAELQRYNAVLVVTDRVPNGEDPDAGKADVEVNDHGFIRVDKQLCINVPRILTISDIVGQPMLAHKGVHEGHAATEVIANRKHHFDPRVIPSITHAEPEVAWVSLIERETKEKDISYEAAAFPWAVSDRAIASDYTDSMTKLIFNKEFHRVIGGVIIDTNGGRLLGEIGPAIEIGYSAEDATLTIHTHPTLYESVDLVAEMFEDNITDLPNLKAKKK